jgi:hypothetical protein
MLKSAGLLRRNGNNKVDTEFTLSDEQVRKLQKSPATGLYGMVLRMVRSNKDYAITLHYRRSAKCEYCGAVTPTETVMYATRRRLTQKFIDAFIEEMCGIEMVIQAARIEKTPFGIVQEFELNEITAHYMCAYCEENLVFADTFDRPDNLLAKRIYSHGCAAYYASGLENGLENVERVFTNLGRPDFQICCADKKEHIGPIGVYVKGDVKVVSNVDLHSAHHKGRRYFEKYQEKFLAYTCEDYQKRRNSHKEIIMVPEELVGIWLDAYEVETWNEIVKLRRKLTEKYNVPVYIINLKKAIEHFIIYDKQITPPKNCTEKERKLWERMVVEVEEEKRAWERKQNAKAKALAKVKMGGADVDDEKAMWKLHDGDVEGDPNLFDDDLPF